MLKKNQIFIEIRQHRIKKITESIKMIITKTRLSRQWKIYKSGYVVKFRKSGIHKIVWHTTNTFQFQAI